VPPHTTSAFAVLDLETTGFSPRRGHRIIEIAIIRFRSDTVRGTYRRVLLPSGEVLNMLGRAARPHHVSSGVGVALIDRKVGKNPQVQELITAIKAGKGGTVSSRLPDSFGGIMRFVLAAVVERGETTREDIASAYTRTLAYHADPRPVHFDRSFEEDMGDGDPVGVERPPPVLHGRPPGAAPAAGAACLRAAARGRRAV
jgi:hypothetical protein